MGAGEAEGSGGTGLAELLEEGKAFAAEEFSQQGHVVATAIIISNENAVLLEMDPEQPPDREEFRDAIVDAVRQTDAHGVCIVAEIWFDTFSLHAEMPVTPAPDNRGEALLVCAEDHTGRSVCALSRIKRDQGVSLDEWRILANIELHGVFTGFFRQRRVVLPN